MKYIVLLIAFTVFSSALNSQELNCQVNVVSNPSLDVTTTEKEIFSELETVVFELMNSTSWTKDDFEVEERINCVLQISITGIPSTGTYEATMQVQSTRPVYNTTYNTTMFNYMDEDVRFNFQRNTRLQFSENQFENNLTSILAFYAYYLIGLDGDSFALNGGDPYFDKAQNVVTLAQSAGSSGWRASQKGRRNRYWLIENRLQELFTPMRECNYEYHRNGLDKMYDDQEAARKVIHEALKKLVPVNNARPGSVNVSTFLQSKRNEIGKIFKDASQKNKNDVLNLLKRLDPANSSKYQEILE